MLTPREVILSAGVIGTPKILLLSGIGPVDELKALGIETVVESPDVGHHFYDHPLVPLYFSVHSNETFDNLLRNPDLIGAAVGEIMANGTGPLVDSPANTLHYSRVDFESLLPGSSDPANSADSAHVEIIFCTGFAALSSLQQPASGGFTSLLAAVVSPLSEGNVTLNSTDPFANPLIDPAYLTHEFDQAAMVTAIKDGFDFIRQPPLDEFVGAPFGPLADATTDDELLAYARSFGVTLNHGSGTARMAAKSSKDGVVDPDLLVKGVKGLRIVDASIFPQQPNVHTQAVVYIAAERAAELIKSAYSLN
ncbi:hypothetical protein VTK73DRAFT_4032 [Phialemonium thermophilum]|uniref:GMC oxidoreductase n=1 Tax=Phialemonium thermophilum TaxID=223376 RepID=A0ABR3VE06_9PEZI